MPNHLTKFIGFPLSQASILSIIILSPILAVTSVLYVICGVANIFRGV